VLPLEGDEPLVLKGLQRRVDRTGARGPRAVAALGDLVDQLVAVAGLLGEEQQDGGADVAAGAHPASSPLAARGHERSAGEAVAVPSAAVEGRAVVGVRPVGAGSPLAAPWFVGKVVVMHVVSLHQLAPIDMLTIYRDRSAVNPLDLR
jgi:hypothetical protein